MTDPHRALYPHHGDEYTSAMHEAKIEYDNYVKTESVPRGIVIYSNRRSSLTSPS